MITGGLGLIGSAIARRLVSLGAEVLLVDSMIPDYGGNLANIADIRDRVTVNIADIRGGFALPHLLAGQDFLFNLAAQTSHLDSMSAPEDDLAINCTAQLQLLEAFLPTTAVTSRWSACEWPAVSPGMAAKPTIS